MHHGACTPLRLVPDIRAGPDMAKRERCSQAHATYRLQESTGQGGKVGENGPQHLCGEPCECPAHFVGDASPIQPVSQSRHSQPLATLQAAQTKSIAAATADIVSQPYTRSTVSVAPTQLNRIVYRHKPLLLVHAKRTSLT